MMALLSGLFVAPAQAQEEGKKSGIMSIFNRSGNSSDSKPLFLKQPGGSKAAVQPYDFNSRTASPRAATNTADVSLYREDPANLEAAYEARRQYAERVTANYMAAAEQYYAAVRQQEGLQRPQAESTAQPPSTAAPGGVEMRYDPERVKELRQKQQLFNASP